MFARGTRNGRLGKVRPAFGGCNGELDSDGQSGRQGHEGTRVELSRATHSSHDFAMLRRNFGAAHAQPSALRAQQSFEAGHFSIPSGIGSSPHAQMSPTSEQGPSSLELHESTRAPTPTKSEIEDKTEMAEVGRMGLCNDHRVHQRTRENIVSDGGALSRPARAVENWAPAAAERTVKSARPAFGGCNAS